MKKYRIVDDDIYFNSMSEIKKLKKINYGTTSDVYFINIDNIDYILKIYNKEYSKEYDFLETRLKTYINIDSYVSPKKIAFINKKFSGYLMNYLKGYELNESKFNISLDDFAKNASKLISDTIILSNYRYRIYDVLGEDEINLDNIFNVMYDDGFKMIDLDDYCLDMESSIDEIKEHNLYTINKVLIYYFLTATNLISIIDKDEKFKNFVYKYINENNGFMTIFNTVIMQYYANSKKDINKIKDIGKVLVKYNKKNATK